MEAKHTIKPCIIGNLKNVMLKNIGNKKLYLHFGVKKNTPLKSQGKPKLVPQGTRIQNKQISMDSSCEIAHFAETHHPYKLCVILRYRVFLGVCPYHG